MSFNNHVFSLMRLINQNYHHQMNYAHPANERDSNVHSLLVLKKFLFFIDDISHNLLNRARYGIR